MPIRWYYPTGSSGPVPCEWLVVTESGESVYVYLYLTGEAGEGTE